MTLSLASPPAIGYFAAKMRSRRSVGILASLALAALVTLDGGCTPVPDTTTSSTSTAVGNPTVSVDPDAFLTGVPCTGQLGGMESYVATITDVGPLSPDGTAAPYPYPIALPSSPPTACSQSVYFAAAVGHHYEAVIDGYEEPVSQLAPVCSVSPNDGAQAPASGGACTRDLDCSTLGCFGRCLREDATTPCLPQKDPLHPAPCGCLYTPALGDRHMLAPGTANPVTPRWTTPANQPCGYRTTDVAVPYTNIGLKPCDPLVDGKPGSPTGLEILTQSALGTYGCAASATVSVVVGMIDVLLDGQTPTLLDTVACGKPYEYPKCAGEAPPCAGLAPNAPFAFVLGGYKKGELTPSFKASCAGTTVKGLITTATCDPFVPM